MQGSTTGNPSTRRALLSTAVLLAVPGLLTAQQQAAASRRTLQQDPRLLPLQQFWASLVAELQQQLSASFAPALVFYGPAEQLPSGAPGDPAAEYNKQTRGSCGTSTSGFSQPYAVCPLVPGGLPASDTARDCCRHFAYCVPRSRYAFAAIDRQSSVVASPRLALAEPDTWQGVLLHEMGHCIDFHVFGERYRLPAEAPPRSAYAAAALAAIDAAEADAELRADRMANALLVPALGGEHLCYSVQTRVQRLVPPSVVCMQEDEAPASSSSSSSGALFMEHFPHPPVAA
uniref:Leishmanolysin-like peptidase n=1 Tax=Tetradesmus obliquus TaxID=3088 RepID=A0A383WJG6_TETOB|eukprot:jgi/Sobl393_1/1010/SZX77598.1